MTDEELSEWAEERTQLGSRLKESPSYSANLILDHGNQTIASKIHRHIPDKRPLGLPSSSTHEQNVSPPDLYDPDLKTKRFTGSVELDMADSPEPLQPSAPNSKPIKQKRIIKGRFELVEKLGSGGMGAVYKAIDHRRSEMGDKNHFVAVKLLNSSFKHHPDAKVALQREFSKSQSLAHCLNIVQVYDFDVDGDLPFMVMEYLVGQDLDKCLRQGGSVGLPEAQAFEILKGICAGLNHAHRAGLIHSDLKPANIFITDHGIPKVFDFGIVRAAGSKIEADGEKSVFDPSALGAYTPNYASLEMLNGDEPDARDDVYALAVVTYMLYAGRHPFQKQPADVAYRKRLIPEKITRLSKRQWRVLEKGLAFKREDRIVSVQAFLDEFTYQRRIRKKVVAGIIINLFIVGALVLFGLNGSSEQSTYVNQAELTSQIEMQFYRSRLEDVLQTPAFEENWTQRLRQEYQDAQQQMQADDPWLITQTKEIITKYKEKIQQELTKNNVTLAAQYLQQLNPYFLKDPAPAADILQVQILIAGIEQQVNSAIQTEQERIQEEKSALRAKQHEQAETERQQQLTQQKQQQRREENNRRFNLVLQQLQQQLDCTNGINPQHIGNSIQQLEKLDAKRARPFHSEIQQLLKNCIVTTAQHNPNKARTIKRAALALYPNNQSLAAHQIESPDTCYRSMAGQGGGARSGCRDPLSDDTSGPVLMVIPGYDQVAPFAITKYEISRGEFHAYCQATGKCGDTLVSTSQAQDLPITDISLEQAQRYAAWLSTETSFTYEIPNVAHWRHAAHANNEPVDPNRNCSLNIKGIKKGESLRPVAMGKANAWGLVNHVGNAQEWAINDDKGVYVLGAAHTHPMTQCTTQWKRRSTRVGNAITSFRLIRKLR